MTGGEKCTRDLEERTSYSLSFIHRYILRKATLLSQDDFDDFDNDDMDETTSATSGVGGGDTTGDEEEIDEEITQDDAWVVISAFFDEKVK